MGSLWTSNVVRFSKEAGMRRLVVLGGCVCLLVVLVGVVVSADKWVRGKVTAVGADSVTVMFKGKEMKFAVGSDTDVQGRGLGTSQRRTGGVKLAEAIKVGDGVEVHYAESGGTLRATDIRTGLTGGDATSEDTGDSASGQITALTATSLTIKTGSGAQTFSIDPKTLVLARGAGAATKEARAGGGGPAITDLVKVGEEVVVTYRTAGKTNVANEVRVRSPR
jgi:hypothetical protein